MQKIVINKCFGGFGLSRKAVDLYCEEKGIDPGEWDELFGHYRNFDTYSIKRDDSFFVKLVETLGKEANGQCADLVIVEVPDGIKWQIEEYDGSEHIAEKHRTWG